MTDKTGTMTYREVHAILDTARSGDVLTVVRTNGYITSSVRGPVLGDQYLSRAVGIDLLDGEPHEVRDHLGNIWGQFLRVELEKGAPR